MKSVGLILRFDVEFFISRPRADIGPFEEEKLMGRLLLLLLPLMLPAQFYWSGKIPAAVALDSDNLLHAPFHRAGQGSTRPRASAERKIRPRRQKLSAFIFDGSLLGERDTFPAIRTFGLFFPVRRRFLVIVLLTDGGTRKRA